MAITQTGYESPKHLHEVSDAYSHELERHSGVGRLISIVEYLPPMEELPQISEDDMAFAIEQYRDNGNIDDIAETMGERHLPLLVFLQSVSRSYNGRRTSAEMGGLLAYQAFILSEEESGTVLPQMEKHSHASMLREWRNYGRQNPQSIQYMHERQPHLFVALYDLLPSQDFEERLSMFHGAAAVEWALNNSLKKQ